jgi:hypothetical protein
MLKGEALPGNWLSQDDFREETLCKPKLVQRERVGSAEDGKVKPVMYVEGSSNPELDVARGIVLGDEKWDQIAAIMGSADSDDWMGRDLVVFRDPTVEMKGRVVGGIRFRAPKVPVAPTTPAPAQTEEPPPNLMPDDVPF